MLTHTRHFTTHHTARPVCVSLLQVRLVDKIAFFRTLGEIGDLLPNNQRQRRTRYTLCHVLHLVSAAHMSIFQMDSNSTSYVQVLDL